MGHWEIRQEELLRQRERISADFLSRQIGVALTCGAFSFFGPLVLGLSVYAICAATEYVEMRLFRRVGVSLTPAVYAALLANSLIAFCAFSFLGAYLRAHRRLLRRPAWHRIRRHAERRAREWASAHAP